MNHAKVSEMLAQKKAGVSDREFFTSKMFMRHLEDIARAVTKRYSKTTRIKVSVGWNERDGMVACTNDKTILINAINDLIGKCDRQERYHCVLGLLSHELGHCFYTEFPALENFKKKMAVPAFYPSAPNSPVAGEVLSYFNGKYKEIIFSLAARFSNIMEDGYIEDRMLRTFPGSLGYGLEKVRALHWEEIPSLTHMIEEEAFGNRHPLMTLQQLMLEYVKFGKMKYSPDCIGNQSLQKMFELIPMLDRMLEEDDGTKRFGYVNELFCAIWDEIKDYLEYLETMAQNQNSSTYSQNQEQQDSVKGTSSQGSGRSQPICQSPDDERSTQTSSSKDRQKTRETAKQNRKDSGDENEDGNADSSQSASSNQSKKSKKNNSSKEKGKQSDSTEENGSEDADGGDENPDDSKKSSGKTNDTDADDSDDRTGNSNGTDADDDSEEPGSCSDNGDDSDGNNVSEDGDDADAGDNSDGDTADIDSKDGDGDNASDGGNENGNDSDVDGDTGDNTDGSTDGNDSSDNADSDSSASDNEDFSDGNTSDSQDNLSGNADSGNPNDNRSENQTDELEEVSGDSEIEYNDDYAAALNDKAAEEIASLLDTMAENAVVSELEDKRERDLSAFANSLDYGNKHSGVNVVIHRQKEVSDEAIEQYHSIAPALMVISKRLRKNIEQKLRDALLGGKMTSLPMGRRLESRNLYRNDGRVFYKTNLPQDPPSLAIGVVIDESGSMSYNQRYIYARAAAIILYDFCHALNIPIAIYGQSTEGGRFGYGRQSVSIFSYAEFDAYDNKDKYRLMDISARANSRDPVPVRFVSERLLKRNEQEKILIVFSDGQPVADGFSGSSAYADLAATAREYERKGIHIIAAAIGDDKPAIENIYGDAFMDITDLNTLPKRLTDKIKKFIRV